MANFEVGPVFSDIGKVIVHDLQVENPKGVVMYAEMIDGRVSCAVYRVNGRMAIYTRCSSKLVAKIRLVWGMEAQDKRWSTLTYRVKGVRFDVTMSYPETLNESEDFAVRRDRFELAHFKGKLIYLSDAHD